MAPPHICHVRAWIGARHIVQQVASAIFVLLAVMAFYVLRIVWDVLPIENEIAAGIEIDHVVNVVECVTVTSR